MGQPEHPTALVTGGNRGIGRAITAGLVASGHRVVIGVRDISAGEVAARQIGAARAVALDLQAPAGFSAVLADIGGVDVLVNNAGVLIETSMIEDPGGFHTSVQVMMLGPFQLIRGVVPHMRAQGWGRIVNVSSGWGSFAEGLAGPGAYGVAKAGLNALTKALVRDLPPGVKINAMCPGWVRTRMGGPAAPRSAQEGAETALWLAQLPRNGPTGGMFRNRKPVAW
ncbi:MAG: SDR family NAD(P)-dependent oxidoreductase [Rhodobacteraceae bacterium]|nr:SDR family NAD(P)-dependent oxidoreductase [Paracoccaceae bacterium]